MRRDSAEIALSHSMSCPAVPMEHKFGIVSGMTAPCHFCVRCALRKMPQVLPTPHRSPNLSPCPFLGGSHENWGSLLSQRQRVDRLVWQPLCSLSDMLEGPQQLVKKRLDKLLDYEEIQERKSEMGTVSYDEEAAMNTYLAINELLVAELPQFNQVALQLLGQILRSFSALQLDLAAQVLQEAEKELEQVSGTPQPLDLPSSGLGLLSDVRALKVCCGPAALADTQKFVRISPPPCPGKAKFSLLHRQGLSCFLFVDIIGNLLMCCCPRDQCEL